MEGARACRTPGWGGIRMRSCQGVRSCQGHSTGGWIGDRGLPREAPREGGRSATEGTIETDREGKAGWPSAAGRTHAEVRAAGRLCRGAHAGAAHRAGRQK
jgi:hypothetical protein